MCFVVSMTIVFPLILGGIGSSGRHRGCRRQKVPLVDKERGRTDQEEESKAAVAEMNLRDDAACRGCKDSPLDHGSQRLLAWRDRCLGA